MQTINTRNTIFSKQSENNNTQFVSKYSYITNETELVYRNSQGTINSNVAIQIIGLVTNLNKNILTTKTIGLKVFYLVNNK